MPPAPPAASSPAAPVPAAPAVSTLGAAIDRLGETVAHRAGEAADDSYTAALLARGVAVCAKKLGEEGVELALAAVQGDARETVKEAADLVYHLTVLLRACGIDGADVAAELARREGVSGLAEKAGRA